MQPGTVLYRPCSAIQSKTAKHIHCSFASRSAVCCYLLFLPVPGHHTKDEKTICAVCMHVTLPGHATVRPGQRILILLWLSLAAACGHMPTCTRGVGASSKASRQSNATRRREPPRGSSYPRHLAMDRTMVVGPSPWPVGVSPPVSSLLTPVMLRACAGWGWG